MHRSPLSPVRALTRVRALLCALACLLGTLALTTAVGAAAPLPGAPRLSALPRALVPRPGQPLTVVLASGVTPDGVRAAAIAGGAVAGSSGSGLPIRVILGQAAHAFAARGPVIVIRDRPGAARLALAGPANAPRLTITGSGGGLLTAARLLASPNLGVAGGRTLTVHPGMTEQLTSAPSPASVPVSPASTSGRGALTAKASFILPVQRELTGDAILQLGTVYDSPTGGRVRIALPGGEVAAFTASPSGTLRRTTTLHLSGDPTLAADLVPGWWAEPGANTLTISAEPNRAGDPSTLSVLAGSRVTLRTRPRPPGLQLSVWPFPLYGSAAWSRTTVVLPPGAGAGTLSSLLAALAGTARVTGVVPDPAVSTGTPPRSAIAGNLLFVGGAAKTAAAGRLPGVRLHARAPQLPGTLEEARIAGGGVALLAYGAPGLDALGPAYRSGALQGRAVLVDATGRPRTLLAGTTVAVFGAPERPWLVPAVLLAVLMLAWITLQILRARRRLVALPRFDVRRYLGGAR